MPNAANCYEPCAEKMEWGATLEDNVGQEKVARCTLRERHCQFLGDLRGGVGEVAHELPVCARKEENEDDVDEEEEEVEGRGWDGWDLEEADSGRRSDRIMVNSRLV